MFQMCMSSLTSLSPPASPSPIGEGGGEAAGEGEAVS